MILEVGCGSGIVTDYLRERNWNILGVDPGLPKKVGKQKHYITYDKEARDLPENTRKDIEVLALFDVLEHIYDPVKFLSELLKVFPKATTLIATVPAKHELWTNFDDHYGHFRRYSLSQLNNEIACAGFKKVFAGYFFHLLYLFILFTKISNKHREVVFKPPQFRASIRLHRFLAEILKWEFVLLPSRIPGSSIIAVYAVR